MNLSELEASLKGATHANIRQLAKDNFTPEFLRRHADGLFNATRMTSGMGGFNIVYIPTELDKCVLHYCAMELVGNLWGFSTPTLRGFIGNDNRFKLDEALAASNSDPLTKDIAHNLNVGKKFIFDTTSKLYEDWENVVIPEDNVDLSNPMTIMYVIYQSHFMLINGGDWSKRSVLLTTFTSAGRELFDWVRDYPDISRDEVEGVVENSLDGIVDQTNQLGIKSTAQEQVVRDATARGELAFVLDPEGKKIIFNPILVDDRTREEDRRKENFPDQTQLVLMCPAKFVPSSLYTKGSMIHDLLRFRGSVFTEIYLATHNRR